MRQGFGNVPTCGTIFPALTSASLAESQNIFEIKNIFPPKITGSVWPRHKYKFNVQTLKWSRSNLTNNSRGLPFLFQLFPASQQTKRFLLKKKVLKYFLSFLRLGGGEFGEITGPQCRDLLLFRLVVTIQRLRLPSVQLNNCVTGCIL